MPHPPTVYDQLAQAIGQELKAARERAELTQKAVAAHIHRDRKRIFEAEKGLRPLSAVELILVARFCNTDTNLLIGSAEIVAAMSKL
jgi:transcriptional regulator with XRE-family HTH domain